MYICTTGAYRCDEKYGKIKSYLLTLNMKGAVPPMTRHHITWETIAPKWASVSLSLGGGDGRRSVSGVGDGHVTLWKTKASGFESETMEGWNKYAMMAEKAIERKTKSTVPDFISACAHI